MREKADIDYSFDLVCEYKNDDKFEASMLRIASKEAAPSYSAYVSIVCLLILFITITYNII